MQRTYQINQETPEVILEKVYQLAYQYERTNGSCAQCVIAAIEEVFGYDFSFLFEASYGLGAGVGLSSKGTCGALNGICLVIGALIGRERQDFHLQRNPDCYAMCRQATLDFEKTYGTILCHGVQTKIMGRSYDLAIEEEAAAFNEAGGHEDKCTHVVGDAARRVAQLILDGELPL